jgi:hypothetical protein
MAALARRCSLRSCSVEPTGAGTVVALTERSGLPNTQGRADCTGSKSWSNRHARPRSRVRYFGMRRTGVWLAVLGTLVGIGTVIALWLIIAYLHRS